MIFWLITSWWFWIIFFVLFFYISDLLKETKRLKKRNDYLEDENNELKKIIFDLNEEKQYLKEIIIAFKNGKITRNQLVKDFQVLIFKEDEERAMRKAQKLKNKIKISEIYGIDLKEKD